MAALPARVSAVSPQCVVFSKLECGLCHLQVTDKDVKQERSQIDLCDVPLVTSFQLEYDLFTTIL